MAQLKYHNGTSWVEVPASMFGINSDVAKEVPTGSINGSNTSFTTSSAYQPSSLQVFVNGVRQGISHVTETTPSSGVFTLDTAPSTGDNVEVSYTITGSNSGNADTVDNFHANSTPTANTIPVLDSSTKLPNSTLPDWQNWTPTITGFSSNPTGGIYRYIRVGNMVTLFIRQPNDGTSNSTGFTISLPLTAATITNAEWQGSAQIRNSGSTATAPGLLVIASGGTTLTVYINYGGNTFTSSGGKRVGSGMITYECEP